MNIYNAMVIIRKKSICNGHMPTSDLYIKKALFFGRKGLKKWEE
jgi:hypothetical protein